MVSLAHQQGGVVLVDDAAVTTGIPSEAGDKDSVRSSEVFQATDEWQEVKPGQVLPSGLHYRLNLSTGKKEAKLLDKEGKKRQDDSIADIADDGTEAASDNGRLRSYHELQQLLAEQKMKLNTEFEMISVLVEHYGNSSTEDRAVILEDLEYLLHQYDNADDFAAYGGLDKIVRPAMEEAGDGAIREKAAILFGSCVQSQPKVQERALNAGWMEYLVSRLAAEPKPLVRLRTIHSISALVRGNARALGLWEAADGRKAFLALLEPDTETLTEVEERLRLKILTFFADLSPNDGGLGQASAFSASPTEPELCSSLTRLFRRTESDPIGIDTFEKLVGAYFALGATTCGPEERREAVAAIEEASHKLEILEPDDDPELFEGLREKVASITTWRRDEL